MKNIILKFGITVFLAAIFVGCDKDEASDETLIDAVDLEETELTAKVDNATEVLSDTFLQVYETEESDLKSPIHPYLPECVTITIEITDTSKDVLVDFGEEGCEVRGHLVKGKLTMSYAIDLDAKTKIITYSLDDFFIDDIQFEGTKTVTRQRMNENGNPQYMMDLDLKVTFADGTEASRKGAKTREWVEGVLNGNWGDNVFLITGAWETNFANGNTHSTTITTALRREASCRFLVSGVVDLVRTNYSGVLDYGDGSCDNLALFTNSDGEEREIRL
ncbi:hypothetical protein M0D21_11470 [Aquimarina sp. D1M17]|uniref:hypothetical protein n=1 Tax=Aquimarina acroporae TaxID=2937283 RepID=UPI0020C041AC|nr:hypothetical protein [Aquimarina acroporae]MCK8522193.1 hypothetical protein [Aquimarina acroporae]